MAPRSDSGRAGRKTAGVVLSAVLLAALWLVLSDGSPASWVVGGPAVLAATWAATRLRTGAGIRVSVTGILQFIPFFLWESLRGGVDVALRTLAPRLRVDPAFARYRIRLAAPGARVFMANCVSLLPGTLAAELEGDWLTIHALSTVTDSELGLQRLERAVARLLSEDRESLR